MANSEEKQGYVGLAGREEKQKEKSGGEEERREREQGVTRLITTH